MLSLESESPSCGWTFGPQLVAPLWEVVDPLRHRPHWASVLAHAFCLLAYQDVNKLSEQFPLQSSPSVRQCLLPHCDGLKLPDLRNGPCFWQLLTVADTEREKSLQKCWDKEGGSRFWGVPTQPKKMTLGVRCWKEVSMVRKTWQWSRGKMSPLWGACL